MPATYSLNPYSTGESLYWAKAVPCLYARKLHFHLSLCASGAYVAAASMWYHVTPPCVIPATKHVVTCFHIILFVDLAA